MNPKLKKSGKTLSENDVCQFEQRIGFALPLEFRSFMKSSNGGVPIENTFDHKNENYLIEEFLLLKGPRSRLTVEDVLESSGDYFPSQTIPIALIFGNSFLLLNKKGQVLLKIMDEVSESTLDDLATQKKAGIRRLGTLNNLLKSLRADPKGNWMYQLHIPKTITKKSLAESLKKLGCRKMPSEPDFELWNWPKYKSDGKRPAMITMQPNRKEGTVPKFEQYPKGERFLVVVVKAAERRGCFEDLAAAIPDLKLEKSVSR